MFAPVMLLKRWKLLGAFVLALLLCGLAAVFSLRGIARTIDVYAQRIEPSASAARQADTINTLFISRHKVLKDAYLFSADPVRVAKAVGEVAEYDQQILELLAHLRANPALDAADQQAIAGLSAPLDDYLAASQIALDLVRTYPDPYAAQQAAVQLTYLKDRPISHAITELSSTLHGDSADQATLERETSQSIFSAAIAATLAALVLGLACGVVAISVDMAERKRTDAALRSGAARLRLESDRLLALHRASSVLASQTGDPSAVLDEVLRSAVTLMGATSGSLHRWLPEEGVLRAVRSRDVTERHLTPDTRPAEGMVGQTFLRRAPLIVNDYHTWEFALEPARRGDLRAVLGVPLMRSGKCLGVLILRVYGNDPKRFTDDDAQIAALFANQAAEALFRADAFEEQRWAALHDALTGLPNRIVLQSRLKAAIETAAPGESLPMALLVMDLDRFKEINDTLGHHCGDLLLQQIGPRLQPVLRDSDTLARLGGDEFALLLPETDVAGATAIAERLLCTFEAQFEVQTATVDVGLSIGIALYPHDGTDAETLLRRADMAMYMAKSDRSGWALYSPERDHFSPDRLALVADLRRAIDRDELVLYYQPQVDVRTGELVAVEALMRWPHPERGLLAPDEFIPLAEQTQLIRPLTRWAIGAALRQSVIWQANGIVLPVSVNLSAHDVQDPRLPQVVAELLHLHGTPAQRLRLEITESSLLGDPERAQLHLAALRALGVRISIDDFGTGYSSLSYLQRLPIDELKIDKSFVTHMATDSGARAIVRAVIDMAEDLGLEVVGEGVEDHSTWEVLASLGCDVAQGYYFSRPLPRQPWLAGWRSHHISMSSDSPPELQPRSAPSRGNRTTFSQFGHHPPTTCSSRRISRRRAQ